MQSSDCSLCESMSEALRHQSHFIPLDGPIQFVFYYSNPFTPNSFLVFRKVNDFPCIIPRQSTLSNDLKNWEKDHFKRRKSHKHVFFQWRKSYRPGWIHNRTLSSMLRYNEKGSLSYCLRNFVQMG